MLEGAEERLRASLQEAYERHRSLRTTSRVARRSAAGIAAVALVALAVTLAATSGVGDVFTNLGKTLLTAAVLGAIAWLWLYSWTSARATRRLRDKARRSPRDLFPIPPRVGSARRVVGRDQVVADLAASLKPGSAAGPQVIVGPTGSGKTSVLLKLAAHLAERDRLPIVISLRGRENVDFTAEAKARFRDYIDPHVRTEDEADRLWRWMCRRGNLVVLADDLDRARLPGHTTDPHRLAARLALDSVRTRDLPTVVASRPQGVPPDLPEPPIELGPLDWAGDPEAALPRAAATVLERAGKRGGDLETRARASIDAANVLTNAFYIDVIADLLRADKLPEPPAGDEHAVRVALLNAWRETVRGDATVAQSVRDRRELQLQELERFAADELVPPEYRGKAAPGARSAEPRELAEAKRFGEAAGILEVEDDGTYRFAHDVLHAHFAGRMLPSYEHGWREALTKAPDAPRIQLALTLAAAHSGADGFTGAACQALIAERDNVADEQRLLRAAAAAEVARAGRVSDLDDLIADECIAARGDASVVAKRFALDQLAQLTGDRALLALWDYADDADYGVRRMAAQKLVERFPATDGVASGARAGVKLGAPAYAVLAPAIRRHLTDGRRSLEERPDADDWDPVILSLKIMAWILPALRTRARRAGNPGLAALLDEHLSELLRLEREGVTQQRGLEASVAQGFKTDALMHPDAEIDDEVRELLGRPVAFWYSQLNLVHAVTLRGGRGDEAARLIIPCTASDRHPYVRAAARMCIEVLERRSGDEDVDVSRYVWEDEGVVVARDPAGLAPEAAQLVGEIAVLLNLNETGSQKQREEFGRVDELPYCMEESRDRDELFDDQVGCHCRFQLCPYRPASNRLSAHREISRRFCRHQRLHAVPGNARKWGSRVRRGALREFWRRLESLARG